MKNIGRGKIPLSKTNKTLNLFDDHPSSSNGKNVEKKSKVEDNITTFKNNNDNHEIDSISKSKNKLAKAVKIDTLPDEPSLEDYKQFIAQMPRNKSKKSLNNDEFHSLYHGLHSKNKIKKPQSITLNSSLASSSLSRKNRIFHLNEGDSVRIIDNSEWKEGRVTEDLGFNSFAVKINADNSENYLICHASNLALIMNYPFPFLVGMLVIYKPELLETIILDVLNEMDDRKDCKYLIQIDNNRTLKVTKAHIYPVNIDINDIVIILQYEIHHGKRARIIEKGKDNYCNVQLLDDINIILHLPITHIGRIKED